MASTPIKIPVGLLGLTLTVDVVDPSDLSVLETVTLTETSGVYAGTVTGAHSGYLLFNLKEGTTVIDQQFRTLADTTTTQVIATGLEIGDIRSKTDLIGSVTFLISGAAVSSGGSIDIKAGDRHQFTLTSDSADAVPDLTGVTMRFGVKGNTGDQLLETTTGITIDTPTGLQAITIVLTPAQTILLPAGAWHWDLQAEYSGTDIRTVFTGSLTVKPDYSGVA